MPDDELTIDDLCEMYVRGPVTTHDVLTYLRGLEKRVKALEIEAHDRDQYEMEQNERGS